MEKKLNASLEKTFFLQWKDDKTSLSVFKEEDLSSTEQEHSLPFLKKLQTKYADKSGQGIVIRNSMIYVDHEFLKKDLKEIYKIFSRLSFEYPGWVKMHIQGFGTFDCKDGRRYLDFIEDIQKSSGESVSLKHLLDKHAKFLDKVDEKKSIEADESVLILNGEV